MKVLLIGSGGREHALAWKLRQSPQLTQLWVAPGNGGIPESLDLNIDDNEAVLTWCQAQGVDLVVVGPEAPLAAGLVDVLSGGGIKAFGPTQKAAEIERSKAFSKVFMGRHSIPTGAFQIFSEPREARDFILSSEDPVVLKASGLAGGKGVVLPDSLEDALMTVERLMVERQLGEAGAELLVEERLTGPEVSLLAFSDGTCVRLMPPVVDHKRWGEGDTGANTGGMGCVAPAPGIQEARLAEWGETILQATVDGLRLEGRPFVGVLYAGLILTPKGVRVLEFNCRFGDPETQVILPLLESDLLEILLACVEGRLPEAEPRWKSGAAACVVLTSEGYPGELTIKGTGVTLPKQMPPDSMLFQAGTHLRNKQLVTAGGRVAGATGWGENLEVALERAYVLAEQVQFRGRHYRRDIGRRLAAAQ